jgi:hypothetical protein
MLVLENKPSRANSATSVTILQISVSTIPNPNLSKGRNPTKKANSSTRKVANQMQEVRENWTYS